MAGRRVVIPGSHNKVAAALLRILPSGMGVALASASRKRTT
jgi:hypothetical protein